jgi:hypothetical protein
VEDIQKMFGDVAEKLDESAEDALKKFRDRSRSRSRRHGGPGGDKKGRKGSGFIFVKIKLSICRE